MKVSELIAELESYDPEAEVHFVYNNGDYWNTQVAAEILSVDTAKVKFSDRVRENVVIDPNEVDEEDWEEYSERDDVVVLKDSRW